MVKHSVLERIRKAVTSCVLYYFLINFWEYLFKILFWKEKAMSQYYAKISEIEYLKVAWPFCILDYFPVMFSWGKKEFSYHHQVCLKISGFKISEIRWWNFSFITPGHIMCNILYDALRNLVLLTQFRKREKRRWRSVTFSKVTGLSLQLY